MRPKLQSFFTYIIKIMIEKSILNHENLSEWKTIQSPKYSTFREGEIYIDNDFHIGLVNEMWKCEE
jgi:hypothetical protein